METSILLAPRLEALRKKYGTMLKPEIASVMADHIEFLRSSGAVDRAKKTGDAAPPFALDNGHGLIVRSEELLDEGPLVVSFFRGTWCPYCVAEIEALAEIEPYLRARGARVVVISPQAPGARDPKIEESLGLTILYDRDNALARSFGLAYDFTQELRDLYLNVFGNDIAKTNGVDAWQLPMPARYVIDTDGTIVDEHVDPDYRHRPEPTEIIPVLNDLRL